MIVGGTNRKMTAQDKDVCCRCTLQQLHKQNGSVGTLTGLTIADGKTLVLQVIQIHALSM